MSERTAVLILFNRCGLSGSNASLFQWSHVWRDLHNKRHLPNCPARL